MCETQKTTTVISNAIVNTSTITFTTTIDAAELPARSTAVLIILNLLRIKTTMMFPRWRDIVPRAGH